MRAGMPRAELGADVLLASSFEEVPDSADLDAIMIAVPDARHEMTLTAALGGRSAILYEPPLTDQRANIGVMIGRLLASELVTYADLELGFVPVTSIISARGTSMF